MKQSEQLPEELVWGDAGHLSDIAISTLADGEGDLLPPPALEHLRACSQCTRGVSAASLVSVQVGDLLASLARAPCQVEERESQPLPPEAAIVRFPVVPVFVALIVAVAAAVPSLSAFGIFFAQLRGGIAHNAAILMRGLLAAQSGFGSWLPLVTGVAALGFLLAGLSMARWAPRWAEQWDGVS